MKQYDVEVTLSQDLDPETAGKLVDVLRSLGVTYTVDFAGRGTE